jgi:hypothetical protein
VVFESGRPAPCPRGMTATGLGLSVSVESGETALGNCGIDRGLDQFADRFAIAEDRDWPTRAVLELMSVIHAKVLVDRCE